MKLKYSRALMLMIAATFFAAAAMGSVTSPERFHLGNANGASITRSSVPIQIAKTSLMTDPDFDVNSLFVALSADGNDDPHSRSVHCPPDKDDHHNFSSRDDDHKGDGDKDKDKDKDKNKDHDCGKGDDGKNP